MDNFKPNKEKHIYEDNGQMDKVHCVGAFL